MPRIAVVGAGLAGLSAADELTGAGAEVVVLEARDRVGGRVASRTLDNGAVVELGAEFILPGNTEVRVLAERFGLGLWGKGMSYGRREPRGGAPTSADEMEAAAEVAGSELERADPEESARRFLERLDIPAAAREALIARVEISSANSADVVAARDLAGLAHVDAEPAPSVAGGNDRLPAALAERLATAVRLRTPVERVRCDAGGVSVGGDEGLVEADACVIAVPAAVLGRIAFEPPLPAPLADAFAGIQLGHAAKLFAPLRTLLRPARSCRCRSASGPGPPPAPGIVPRTW